MADETNESQNAASQSDNAATSRDVSEKGNVRKAAKGDTPEGQGFYASTEPAGGQNPAADQGQAGDGPQDSGSSDSSE